jgi:hypothetical protein
MTPQRRRKLFADTIFSSRYFILCVCIAVYVYVTTKRKNAFCRYDCFQLVVFYFMCVHRCVCVRHDQERESFLQIWLFTAGSVYFSVICMCVHITIKKENALCRYDFAQLVNYCIPSVYKRSVCVCMYVCVCPQHKDSHNYSPPSTRVIYSSARVIYSSTRVIYSSARVNNCGNLSNLVSHVCITV